MKDKNLFSLVTKAIQGDGAAFEAILTQKARMIVYLCVQQMEDQHDGEDAAQEVFIQMQKGIANLRSPQAFNVWMNRIIYFTCLELKKKHSKGYASLSDYEQGYAEEDESLLACPQHLVEDKEYQRFISDMVAKLPEKYNCCVLMHYYQNMSYAEIARVMDITEDAVNNNLRMARKYLKDSITKSRFFTERANQPQLKTAKSWMAIGPILAVSLEGAAAGVATPAITQSCLAAAGFHVKLTALGGTVASYVVRKRVILAASLLLLSAIAVGAATILKEQPPVPGASALPLPPASSKVPAITGRPNNPGQSGQAMPLAETDYVFAGRVVLASDGKADTGAFTGVQGLVIQLIDAEHPDEILNTTQTSADGQGTFRLAGRAGRRVCLVLLAPSGTTQVGGERILYTPEKQILSLDGNEVIPIGNTPMQAENLQLELRIPTRVQGKISLNADAIAGQGSMDFSGRTLQLLDPQNRLIATTGTNTDGSFLFENPMISQRAEYTVRVVATANLDSGFSFPEISVLLYPGCR